MFWNKKIKELEARINILEDESNYRKNKKIAKKYKNLIGKDVSYYWFEHFGLILTQNGTLINVQPNEHHVVFIIKRVDGESEILKIHNKDIKILNLQERIKETRGILPSN